MPLTEGQKATGLLSPVTAEKFLDLIIQNTPILQKVTTAKVKESVATYPAVTMAQFKTRGYGVTSGDRTTVYTLNNLTQTDVSYSLKELVLGMTIQDSYIEDLDADGEKIAEMVAKMFAKDLQFLVIQGDTSVSISNDQTTVQKILNGIIKQLDTFVYTCPWLTASDTTIIKKLNKLVAGAPDDILVAPNTRIFIAPSDYTALWDDVMTNNKTLAVRDGKIWYRGLELVEQTFIPANRPMIGDLSNVLVPISREVYLESQRYPEARGWKVVLSTRLDVNVYPNALIRVLAKTGS